MKRLVLPSGVVSLSLCSLYLPMILLGYSVLPISHPGVLPSGPYGYDAPPQNHYQGRDPTGAFYEYTGGIASKRSILDGEFPLWNPNQGIGQPSSFVTHQSGWLYPLCWGRLILPYTWWDILYFINLGLTVYFAYLFLTVTGLSRPAALVASLGLFSCGYFQMYIANDEIMRQIPWTFFLLYAVERCFVHPDWRWKMVAVAAGTFCLLTAGNPSPTVLGGLVVVAYTAARTLMMPREFKTAFLIAGSMFLGLVMAAPQWMTLLEYARQPLTSLGPFSNPRLPLGQVPATFLPYAFGRINAGNFLGVAPGVSRWVVWGWLPATISFLAVGGMLTPWKNKPRTPHMILLGICAVLVWLSSAAWPYAQLAQLPLVGRVNYRYAGFVVILGWTALAGRGFSALLRNPSLFFRRALIGWCVLLALLVALLAAYLRSHGVLSLEYLQTQLISKQSINVTLAACALIWFAVVPVSLLSLHVRKIGSPQRYVLLIVGGFLVQAVAYHPNGTSGGQEFAIMAALISYGLLVAASHVLATHAERFSLAMPMTVAGLLMLGVYMWFPGQSKRCDILKAAPYIEQVRTRASMGERVYGMGTLLFPKTAQALGISAPTNLGTMLPGPNMWFYQNCLDPSQHPLRFYGTPLDVAQNYYQKNRIYWDLTATRYLATTTGDLPGIIRYGNTRSSGSGYQVEVLRSPVAIRAFGQRGPFQTVRVLFSTYARKNKGLLWLTAYDVSDSEPRLLAKSTVVSAETLRDNDWQRFEFPNTLCVNAEDQVEVRVEIEKHEPSPTVGIWRSRDAGELLCTFLDVAPSLRLVWQNPETGVRIYESMTAGKRAFIVPSIQWVDTFAEAVEGMENLARNYKVALVEKKFKGTVQPRIPEAVCADMGNVRSIRITANSVHVDCDFTRPGVLVLADAYLQGWQAKVNGQKRTVFPVCGVFRGVWVDRAGPVQVEFRYEPLVWKVSLVLGALGWAGLLAATTVTILHRRRTRANITVPGRKCGETDTLSVT